MTLLADEPKRIRHSLLDLDFSATIDDPLASKRRSSLLSRLVFLLLGLFTIALGGWLLATGRDPYLGAALIGTGLIRFVGIYVEARGYPNAGFLIGNFTGALMFTAALLEIGDAAGLEVWGLLLIGMPPLIMGPQHGRLRPIVVATNLAVVVAAEIAVHLLPPRIDVPPDILTVLRVVNLAAATAILSALVAVYRRMLDRAEERIGEERKISERLLANILPAPIAVRLKRDENPIADGHAAVTVMFADMVNFTPFAASNPPETVVNLLNRMFHAFDDMVESRGLEKIKTIGDAYMVAGGLGEEDDDGAAAVADLAFEMLAFVREMRCEGRDIDLRIGIHTGPLVAGVIGKRKFSYDVWGDTVNTAARLESASEPGRILISEATVRRLGPGSRVEPHGPTPLKGLGAVPTYFLVGGAEPVKP
jgi:class 3 adenylate cyclase